MTIDSTSNSSSINASSSAYTPATESAAASATTSTTAGLNAVNPATQIASLGDLKAKAPEVYNAMIMGIAASMIKQMQRNQQRLKKMMREARSKG